MMDAGRVDYNMFKEIDWTKDATSAQHLWVECKLGDYCEAQDVGCQKKGPRIKCMACKMKVHTKCLHLLEPRSTKCKPTFHVEGVNETETFIRHHWLQRHKDDSSCKNCGKSFYQFSSKDATIVSCSWCKAAYHGKICFSKAQTEELCVFGNHAANVVPPSWIIKRSQNTTSRSSLNESDSSEELKQFYIKPNVSQISQPLLVFINPKSGGNQGGKLMKKFFWMLNPRQVFDLSVAGPKFGLELYRKVPNLHILVCGGDGTVGWILTALDSLGWHSTPPVAILPIGTGNDLARTLKWGGGYANEPISKVLNDIEDGHIVKLDRWNIVTIPNTASAAESTDMLPLNIFNNYFSLGADAQIALQFHENREAHPENFKSRVRNKMFYASAGWMDIIKRSCNGFAENIKLECDDKDLTNTIRSKKLHCLLFLNISRYASGTRPWGRPSHMVERPQRHDDGFLEVIGFTYTSLATLQVGTHGERLAQCQRVLLTTSRSVPVQIDGEPCLMRPSTVMVTFRNKCNMLAKQKANASATSGLVYNCGNQNNLLQPISNEHVVQLWRVGMSDSEMLNYDKEKLQTLAVSLGYLEADKDTNLKEMRENIMTMNLDGGENNSLTSVSDLKRSWCFLDSKKAECFFRINPTLEHICWVAHVCSGHLYILYPDLSSYFYDLPNRSRSVKLDEFKDHVDELHKNTDHLFTKEWIDLYSCINHTPALCGEMACNLEKNRYQSVVPYDITRVKLEPKLDDNLNYINASFIPGYKEQYIATQGPLKTTIDDFWWMLWQYKCKVIVMLANLIEMNQLVKYWPDQLGKTMIYGSITVEMVSVRRENKFINRIFRITQGSEVRFVQQYYILGWYEDCADICPETVIGFVHTIQHENRSAADCGPMIVHCSSGVGRTGVFIALDYFHHWLHDHSLDDEVGVFEYVLKICMNRPFIIQTREQYIFIYDTLNRMIEKKQCLKESKPTGSDNVANVAKRDICVYCATYGNTNCRHLADKTGLCEPDMLPPLI